MARKKKDEPERTCATCGRGPDKDKCMDGEDCESGDLWFPKEPECDGDSCKISVNGGPEVPFPSPEATEQVAEMMKGHPEDQGVIPKRPKQLDLDGKPAEFPIGVEAEAYTVLTFECGSWTLKVREDRLQKAAEDNNILGLVQKRLKAAGDLYPLSEGEFDRWVGRFTRSLEQFLRTGCA